MNLSKIKKLGAYRIGIVPLPIYLTLVIFYLLLTKMNAVTNDLLGALGILIVYSFLLEAIGKNIPVIKDLGGKVLLVTFFPAFMVYKDWLPQPSINIITDFMHNNNFLTFFISLIVVGSIASMNRHVLIKATSRIIFILVLSSFGATLVGLLTAYLLGMDLFYAYFFIVVPVMAGGVGEGALPLSIGYSALLGMTQPEAFGKIIPCVFLGGLIAVILSSFLNHLGEKNPNLTGNGVLLDGEKLEALSNKKDGRIDLNKAIVAGVFAIMVYFIALFLNQLLGLPTPILLLIVVMLMKVLGLISDELLEGGVGLYQFTITAITPLLLFGVGVAMTPWEDIISVITNFKLLFVLFMTVLSVVIISYFTAKKTKLYPIDTAIVISCCSGQGGTGALAILTAGNRMILMPFAQVAVRLGGAITVTIALTLLKFLS
ncbi:2-hydroxycarboxylate transporter family protein [Vagococcus fluvialis]|uniref:2-hydroxycarboxylate transporter family protein n=1 Tax=Vagococcus fluvialis TaxID=2738 RepID=A0A7X6DB55_9ENTE|nr:2-hydroxycarboxylate transporter family protein [Vagococcus fluvialis]NKC69151.1 2-hydroxycarboxylate transporter family protein [Vagococcus fluvialis]